MATKSKTNPPAEAIATPDPGTTQLVDILRVVPSKTNPRTHFEEGALNELADSIRKHGVLQAVLVRPIGSKWEIVCGERRLRASIIAGCTMIPANIRQLDDKQTLEIQVVENLQRSDLSPMEEAAGYAKLIKQHGYTSEVLAAKIGKSISYVRKRTQLMNLEPKAQKLLDEGKLPLGHALLLSRIPDATLQAEALKSCFRYNDTVEPLKDLADSIAREYMLTLAKAPFDITDKILLPAAGSCTDCPYRTGNQKELFDDVKAADICTKPTCYKEKVGAWWKSADTKETKLPAEQSKGLFHQYYGGNCGLKYDSKYVDLAEKTYKLENKSYEQVVKGHVTVFLALDLNHIVHRLALEKDVEAALKLPEVKARLKKPESSGGSSGGNSSWQAQEKRRKLEAQKRKIILIRLDEKFRETLPNVIGGIKTVTLFRYILTTFVLHDSYRITESYAKLHWPEAKGSQHKALIAKRIAKLDQLDCLADIFQAIFFDCADLTNTLNADNYRRLGELLALFGMKVKPFEDAVNKEYADKAKAKKAKERKAAKVKPAAKSTDVKTLRSGKKLKVHDIDAKTTEADLDTQESDEMEDDE